MQRAGELVVAPCVPEAGRGATTGARESEPVTYLKNRRVVEQASDLVAGSARDEG